MYVEYVFVFAAVGCNLFFLAVAVQIDDVDFVETPQQIPPHPSERGVVDKTMVIDISQYPFVVAIHEELSQAYEFAIVIVDPFRIPFLQRLVRIGFFLVILHQAHNPFAFVFAFSAVRRIAQHDHDRSIALDFVCAVGLAGEELGEQCACILVVFFQRIGEKHPQAFVIVGLVTCLCENPVEFQMGHCIGGHQKFESVQTRQQMFPDIALPHSGLSVELVMDSADGFREERACSGCRIEELYLVDFDGLFLFAVGEPFVFALVDAAFDGYFRCVGQTHRQVEFGLQNFVHGLYDATHHGLRCVPYAPVFALFRVVRRKEILVEMYHRIGLLGAVSESGHYLTHICGSKYFGRIIHDPTDPIVQVISGDILKQLAKERVRFRDERRRLVPAESIGGCVVQTRGEHTVNNSLGIDVGEFFRRDVVNQDVFEGLHLPFEIAVAIVLQQRLFDDVGHQSRFCRHDSGQLFRRRDSLRDGFAQAFDDENEFRFGAFHGDDFASFDFGQTNAVHKFALLVKPEIEIIGENNVIERMFITVELLLVLLLSRKVLCLSEIFCLDESYGNIVSQ